MSTVRDLKLVGSDLTLDGSDLGLVSGADALQQKVSIAMQFFLGEWFLDEEAGLPHFQEILVKNPNIPAIAEIFRSKLLSIPGVLGVEQLGLTYSPAQRSLRVDYRVSSDLTELSGSVNLGV